MGTGVWLCDVDGGWRWDMPQFECVVVSEGDDNKVVFDF